MTKKNPWRHISSKIVHKNRWYSVRKDQVIRPDGKEGEFNVVVTPGVVYIAALDSEDHIYLIGQFRYTTNMYSIELPAGGVKKGEDYLAAAKKELHEETGLTATTWQQCATNQTANGLMAEICRVFIATDLTQGEDNEQAEEGIQEVLRVPFAQAFDMIKSGEISDGQSISALTQVALMRRKLTVT